MTLLICFIFLLAFYIGSVIFLITSTVPSKNEDTLWEKLIVIYSLPLIKISTFLLNKFIIKDIKMGSEFTEDKFNK